MPTLVSLDSFQHRTLRLANGAADLWYSATITDSGSAIPCHDGTNIKFDPTVVRTADHACSLKMQFNTSTALQLRKNMAGGNIQVLSMYFRTTDATNPAANLVGGELFRFGGATNDIIGLNTSGQVTARCGAGTVQASATDYCDGQWHRIDAKRDHTTTSGTLDVSVDGVALTQATGTVTAGGSNDWNIGNSTAAAAAAYNIWFSDVVVSNTSADFPIGDHICKMLEINGTGTHSKGSGAFTDQAGGTTDAALLAAVDDAWDGTTPDIDQTGEDFVQQTANDGAGYVEFTFEDPTESTIWDAQFGCLMASEDAATANNCEARLVESDGTTRATTGLVDPSVSATAYTGYRIMASRPTGGWDGTKLSGVKTRFGFSTDAAPDALFNSAIVEYATAWTPPAPGAGMTVSVVTAGL